MFRGLANRRAVAALVFVQVVAAVNWYAASSVFLLISGDLRENVAGLGVITSAFTLGVGLFQLPAGVVAARQGPKRALLYGVVLIAVFSALSGFVSELSLLAILRFLVGAGEAFIFGPGVTLMTRFFRKGSEGLSVGVFSSSFDLGGVAGIFGWAVFGSLVGWRTALAVGGLLALCGVLLLMVVVPSDPLAGEFFVKASELKTILLNRSLLLVGIGMLSLQVAFGLSTYFTVYYLEQELGMNTASAGLVGSLALAASVIASPVAGRVFDRISSPKRWFAGFCAASAVALALAGWTSPVATALSTIVVGGTTAGAFVFAVGMARATIDARKEYEAFGLAWINGLAQFGGVWTPIAFSTLAAGPGFSAAWLLAGGFVAALVLPVLALRSETGT